MTSLGTSAPAATPDPRSPRIRLERVRYEPPGARGPLLDLDLALSAEGRTLVLGPNGAGKTLLLRLLHGLIEPTSGHVSWEAEDPARARRTQAMVFQRTVLLRRSVAGNIRYALAARGVPRRRRRALCEAVLERAGLAGLAREPARRLSGGEQRRVSLARAWAIAPDVLILDEPTADLDPAATWRVEELIDAVHGSGTKIVLATHDLAQARRLADEVVFLHRGRCVEQAPAGRFFAGPSTPEARSYLAGRLLV